MVRIKEHLCVFRSLLYRLPASASGCSQFAVSAANLWRLLRRNWAGMTWGGTVQVCTGQLGRLVLTLLVPMPIASTH